MDAFDVMTRAVVTVKPGTRARDIAGLLLKHNISAVPVVDEQGAVVGMVSEGDLLRFSAEDRIARRDWWLAMVAEGEVPDPELLATLGCGERPANEVMSAPVVTVTEHTDVTEIGQLLSAHRIKRVPVLRDGRIVGIVSRADLIRALAARTAAPPPHEGGLFHWVNHYRPHAAPHEDRNPQAPAGSSKEKAFTAEDFRSLVEAAESKKAAELQAARAARLGDLEHKIADAVSHHVTDEYWHGLLDQARIAAARGDTELLLLRFPGRLCSDGGRAVNVPEPDWPATLRGEAAELYLRFERELRPLGFHLLARILDFPAGFIGDIGLFLYWGGASY